MASGKGLLNCFFIFVGFSPSLETSLFPLVWLPPGREGSEQTRASGAGPVTARKPRVRTDGAPTPRGLGLAGRR